MAPTKKTSKSLIPVRKPAVRKKTSVAKTAPKRPPRPARKVTTTAVPAKVSAPPTEVAAPKADKAKKPKLVRDSFTIPKTEFAVLQTLKQRAAGNGATAKKSEILRAGIKALAGMNDAAFAAALGAVPLIKTGRPAKD